MASISGPLKINRGFSDLLLGIALRTHPSPIRIYLKLSILSKIPRTEDLQVAVGFSVIFSNLCNLYEKAIFLVCNDVIKNLN